MNELRIGNDMGSLGVLVIGDDWREQLDRYKTIDYADPLSPHIVHVDILPRELEDYQKGATWLHLQDGREFENFDFLHEMKDGKGVQLSFVRRPWNIAFTEVVKRRYDHMKLDPGEEPDFSGKHRWGWMRLNEAGEVVELVERTVPGAFFWFFLGTCAEFLLKPGATGWNTGWNIDGNEQVTTEVTEGYAGSARLSDIDFHAMRQKQIDGFQARWDAVHRAANGESWIPFAEIRRKYPQTEKYDEKIERAASDEWWHQPALQNIYNAHCTDNYTHEALDLMLLPRADYAQHRAKRGVLGCAEVIRYGQNLPTSFNEAELLAELDDDALLTLAAVKC
jgi:hypothetical protein